MPSEEAIEGNVRRELENSRQQSQALFEFNPNGVFIISRDGRFASLNPACERIMGYSSQELVGRSFLEVTAPESLKEAQQAFHDAVGGKTVLTRIMGYARDGSKRHLDMSIAPIAGKDGASVLVMAHDVTQRVEAEAERDTIEAALRASEERYQAFISQSGEAIWRFEMDEPIPCELPADAIVDALYRRGYLAECNDVVARMYGYEHADEIIGLRLPDGLPDNEDNRAYLRAWVESGYRLTDAESEEIDRFGETRFFSNNLLGIIEDGRLCRAWGTQRDITDRRANEAAIRAAEERYQVFIAQSTEAIWRYELETPIPLDLPLDEQIELFYELAYLAESNDAMARIYGFPRAAEVIGKRLSELWPRTAANEAHLRALASSGWRLNDLETSQTEADGKTHHYISNLLGIIEDNCVVRAWGTRRDLTERKEVENKLRESQERLDLAIRSGDLGTWEWNLETGEMSCSPLARTMLGLGDEEDADFFIDTGETYKQLESTVYPADRAQLIQECCSTAERHIPLEMEYRVVWPDGTVHWVAVEGRLVQSESVRPTRMIGTCRDITRRKRRELHQSVIAEASQQLASSLDIETTMTAMARLLVPAHADWCVLDLLPDSYNFDSVIQDGAEADGAETQSGRRVAVAHADRNKEQLLWHMKSLAGGGDPLFHSSDDEAQPLLMTEIAAAQMELLWPDPAQRDLMQAAGFHSMMCVPLRARDRTLGALVMVSSSIERVFGDDDLALAQDLARRIALAVDNARLYGQAQQARREAEAANKAKDEFLAVVSHELRTPLTPLLGWIDLINAGRLGPDQSERAFESIGRNAHAQLQLVNDLLDVSRMISGKLPLEPVPLDWREPVEAAVESVAASAVLKKIALIWVPPADAVLVSGDASRLRQVAINLLANAVKFTPAGGQIEISLEVSPRGRRKSDARASMLVRDTGIGISPEFLPHVWDRFRQADASTTRSYGGLGLGLAIVHHIVEAHNGEAEVSSGGIGEGTLFRISLPLAVVPAAETASHEATPEAPAAKKGTPILLVDDDNDARELFTAMLRDSGWDTRSVRSSDQAFALLNDGEWQPSVIISDLALPCIDGYEFIKRVSESRWKSVPVIALTAYARDEDRRRALAAGFVRHLSKPATPDELNEAIGSVLAG